MATMRQKRASSGHGERGYILVPVLGVVLSFYLWASMPLTAAWLLGLLLGINLISEGLSLVVLAWRA